MILINAQQGTENWHKERNKPNTFNASEANALMGVSKYTSYTELLKQKKFGIVKEVSPIQQRLFDRGHEAEASARQIAEEIVDKEFYPTVGHIEIDDMRLLASFDGITVDDSILFEHKLWNESLAESVRREIVPDSYIWQLEQQLLVSGAEKVIFMVSDGTKENCVWCYYESQQGYQEKLINAWKQFKTNLELFEPEPEVIPAIADPVMALPALAIEVSGSIRILSNLDRFGDRLKSFIKETNSKPETDLDFANIEQACKILKEAEDALKQAEYNALSQTASVDDLLRTVSYLSDIARSTRLQFEKIVKIEKENRKYAIVKSGELGLMKYTKELQDSLTIQLITQKVDFSEAIKGKKNLSSMQEAVNNMLLTAKLDINSIAQDIIAKFEWFTENSGDYRFLFNDLQSIIYKNFDDFRLLVTSRVDSHQQQERIKAEHAEKAQAEREERIRREAEEKANRESELREKQIAEDSARKEREKIAHEKYEQDTREKLVAHEFKQVEKKKAELKEESKDTVIAYPKSPGRMLLLMAIQNEFLVSYEQAEKWLQDEFGIYVVCKSN